jgi:hypothetical protein
VDGEGELLNALVQSRPASDIRLALKADVPKLAEAQVPLQVQGEQRLVLKRALEESFVRSFRLAMLVSACGALASARGFRSIIGWPMSLAITHGISKGDADLAACKASHVRVQFRRPTSEPS